MAAQTKDFIFDSVRLREWKSTPEKSGGWRLSEGQAKSKLHRPGSALLILCSHRSETAIQHLCRLSKGGIGVVWIDVSKVRVVQQVECLSAKVKSDPIMDWKVTSSGKIELGGSEGAHEVARCISYE